MPFAEFGAYDALGLAELVRRGEVSARELVDEAFARIDRANGPLNAVVARFEEAARRESEGSLPDGPFRGVPFLIKELDSAVRGVPLSLGSRFFAEQIPDHDSALVAAYRRAGFVIVGKSNAPELGLTPFTEPRLWGPARNPWRPSLTPGGSSGGAGAAVAAGIVPVAHAGDGGGSIRVPASCCGVFGLKPTRGRTPMGPDRSESWGGLVVEHAISRSVRDSAALLDATAVPDPDARFVAPAPARPFLAEVGAPVGRLRLAVTRTPHLPGKLHPDCAVALDDAVALLGSLGHEVEEIDLGIDPLRFGRDFFMLVCVEAAAVIERGATLVGGKVTRRGFETETWLCAMLGRRHSAVEMALARERLHELGRTVMRKLAPYDALVSPTLGSPPVAVGALLAKGAEAFVQELVAVLGLSLVLAIPAVVNATVSRVFSFIPFTPLANVTGQPSMSVPLHWSQDGLPMGTMFTGRLGDEATLFRLAAQLEEARPWKQRRPPVWAG